MTVTLRPDQAKLKADIYDAWGDGARDVLAVAPTGFGKSVLVGDIALDMVQQSASMTVMAHRNELVAQMSGHIARRGIPHNIIAPRDTIKWITGQHRSVYNGRSFYNPNAKINVVGAQTLVSRAELLAPLMATQDYCLTDEGHHQLRHNLWGKARLMMPRAMGLSLTGSPVRSDGQGLGRHADGFIDAMVQGPNTRQLIDMGALCEYQIVCPEVDFRAPDTVAASGDYSQTALIDARKRSHIVGDVVEQYIKWALGKRTIVFMTDVEAAVECAARFNEAGIKAAALSAKSDPIVRNATTEAFARGDITILLNVDLFGEGFDVPACDCVIMARPTASLGMYLQQFGRVLRLFTGKLFGLVIDMVSNVKRHGLPDRCHVWSLDRRDKKAKKQPDPEDIELTVCRNCSRPYERCLPVCPHCGHVIERAPSERTLEQVDGDLTLLTPEILAQMRQSTQLETPQSVLERVSHVAGDLAGRGAHNRQYERVLEQQELAQTLAVWAGVQRGKGRSDSEIYRRFYLATGQDMMTAMSGKRQEMADMKEIVSGWL